MNRRRLAIFDVCGTLYCSNTSFDFLRYYFEKKRNKQFLLFYKIIMLFPVRVINHLLFRYLKSDVIRKLAVRFLRDENIDDIKENVKGFYNEYLKKREINDSIQLMRKLKHTHEVILLSASFDFVIEYIAKQFGVAFIASELACMNDVCLGKYTRDLLYSKKEVFQEFKMSFEDVVVITDNLTDLELINTADSAVVLSKPKNIAYWKNNLRGDYKLIEK